MKSTVATAQRRPRDPLIVPVPIAATPPAAPAAEWELVGRIAAGDEEALSALIESGVGPDDFTEQELRPWIKTALAFAARDMPVSLVSLHDELATLPEARERFSDVNAQLSNILHSYESADQLAARIAERARLRSLQLAIADLSKDLLVASRREGATADDLIHHLQIATEQLSLLGTDRSPASINTVEPLLVTLADVTSKRPLPLWPGYLWLGKIAVLDGDPGLGKSTLTLDLAARVSTGRAMPDGSPGIETADVILLSAEDGIEDTIRPRLDAAGGDVRRIHYLEGWQQRDPSTGEVTESGLTLPSGMPVLEMAIQRTKAKLVVIDPLMAFLGGDVNAHRDHDIRRALRPLAVLAERSGACVLIVRHLNKAAGANALYRGGGSIGIIGAARSGLLVAPDPSDPDASKPGGTRVLALSKSNLGPPMPALRYTTMDTDDGASRIEWKGTVEVSPAQLLAPAPSEDDRTLTDEAAEYLSSALAEGPRRKTELWDEAPRELRGKPLRSAGERLGVDKQRIGFGRGSYVEWALPTSSTEP